MAALRILLAALAMLLVTAESVQAQEQLASARELYASAEYDQALAVLDRLTDAAASHEERQSIELYRTLCFFAVGRRADADRAIETIITRDPLFQPGSEVPPRARTAFSDAKKRLLPGIVQQQYAEAKSAFERSDFVSAATAFRRVLDAIADPDMGAAGRQPPLSDIRTLAAGFHDLSVKSIPPPPAPPAATPAPAPAPEPEPPATAAARIYTGDETGVRPPVAISQELPRYPGVVPAGGLRGVVEVVINPAGAVESATMVMPVQGAVDAATRFASVASSYNKTVLTAASRWQFEPAKMNGVAVPFRKRIQIQIAPPTR